MSVKLNQVYDAWQQANENGQVYAAQVLLTILIEGLPSQQKSALGFILYKSKATAPELAHQHGYKLNHANNLLKRLAEMSLLQREAVVDEVGLHYVYSLTDEVSKKLKGDES